MNFSVILYPSKADFRAWSALGNEGWSADDMAPYFRKFHTFTPATPETKTLLSLDYMKDENQGIDGPLPVTFPDVYGEFNKAWDEALRKLGWQSSDDPIVGNKLGPFTCPLSVHPKTKTRGYAAAYYTEEAAKRPNLQLLTETQVEKVLLDRLDDGSVIAKGVQIRTREGTREGIMAKREVILSAGAINSPQILELSGIGSEEILKKHGIPVVINNPGVGENLQDHCIAAISFEVADGQVSGDVMRDPDVVQSLVKLYEETRGGPLSGMPLSVAYLSLVDGNGKLSEEDIQKLLQEHLDNVPVSSPGLRKQYELLRQILLDPKESSSEYMMLPIQLHMKQGKTTMAELFEKSLPGNYVSILALNNHPFSRGSVHIRSSDPKEKPIFDPTYLSHPLDLEILARHTQYMNKIVETEPLASLLKPASRIPEGAHVSDLESAKQTVKDRLFTCFHPAGTCSMMPEDLGGVVNSRLVVHGTRNLRVVDASIFPLQPLGNIQATVYAVAEKAADIIKEDSKTA